MGSRHFYPVTSVSELQRGDIIRHRSAESGRSYVVDNVYGDRATAVATLDVTNSIEWEVLRPDPVDAGPRNGPAYPTGVEICGARGTRHDRHVLPNTMCPSFLWRPHPLYLDPPSGAITPLVEYAPYRDVHYRMLKLWTKATEAGDYIKDEWRELEAAIERLAVIARGKQ